MKTKITITALTLIFAVILCGAVAAEDTSNSSITDQSDNLTTDQTNETASEGSSDPYNPRLDRHYYGANGIAEALEDPDLQEGDTIEVEAGTYNFLTINTRVDLIATEPNAIIQGIKIESLSAFTGSNYLWIEGFIINNTLGPGIQLDNVEGVQLVDNEVINSLAAAICLDNSDNNIIMNNEIHDNQGTGIELQSSSDNQISDNYIQDNAGVGPDTPGISLVSSSGNSLFSNTIKDNSGVGIILEQSSDNCILSNIIENNDEGIQLIDSSTNEISDNKITQSDYAGIFMRDNSDENEISENTIRDNALEGIRLEGSSNNSIYGNIVQNNGNDGISINFSPENTIGTDNHILNNGGNGIYIESSTNTLIISNNIAGNTMNQIEVSDRNYDGEGQDGVGGGEDYQDEIDDGEGQEGDDLNDDIIEPTDVYVHFNRIIATTGNFAILNTGEGTVYAQLNWWGSNAGPTPEQDVGRGVIYDPWLVMRFTANPTTIQQGGRSTLTADFRYDSDGVFHDPTQGDGGRLPTGLFVKFTTTLGSVGSKEISKEIVDSVAKATLRGDEAAGSAIVGAIFDSQPMTATVTITAASATNTTTNSTDAADTVGMQETGAPLGALILAVIMVLGGVLMPRRK